MTSFAHLYQRKKGNVLPAFRVLSVVQLLTGGLSVRQVAERTGVNRRTVQAIQARMDAGEEVVLEAARLHNRRIYTEETRRVVSHAELISALIRRATVEEVGTWTIETE